MSTPGVNRQTGKSPPGQMGVPTAQMSVKLACTYIGTMGRTVRCVLAVPTPCEKSAILDPFPPMAKVAAMTTAFLYIALLRLLISPKSQIKLCFTLIPRGCLEYREVSRLRQLILV